MINDTINMEKENEKGIELFMPEPITWLLSKIWWFILKILSKFGFEWAKKKFLSKIKIEIERKMELIFATESIPAAWLKFKLKNYSDVDLTPKNIIAWVSLGGVTIDQISWSRQESIFAKSSEIGLYHEIPDLPATSDLPTTISHNFQFYYRLPIYADFGKNELRLLGAIEFDCILGTYVRNFQTSCNLLEDEWRKALNKWQEDLKGKRTIAAMNNYQSSTIY